MDGNDDGDGEEVPAEAGHHGEEVLLADQVGEEEGGDAQGREPDYPGHQDLGGGGDGSAHLLQVDGHQRVCQLQGNP